MPNAHSTPGSRRPWLGLAVLLGAGFVTIFDLFVVNIAIPSLQADFDASLAQVGLVIAGYELAFGALLVTGGRMGDRFGRRRLFVWGMGLFALTSVACGLAPSVEFLIASRVAQGLAAALLFPQVYAVIRVTFEGTEARRAFALLGMTLGLAAIAGQVLGGMLIHADVLGLGWRTIFLINLPLGVLGVAAARWIPESRLEAPPSLDLSGVLLLGAGLTCILVPLLEGPAQGWPLWSLAMLPTAVVLLAAFAKRQQNKKRQGTDPLIDLDLLRDPAFARGGLVVLLVYSTSSSFFLCFALLTQTGLGMDALSAGLLFAPCSVGFLVTSLLAPRLIARWGNRALVGGAASYATAIGVLLLQSRGLRSGVDAGTLLLPLIAVGGGQAMVMTPLLNTVLSRVATERAGMAAGVIATLQQVGAAFGVAIAGMLFGAALQGADTQVGAQMHIVAFEKAMYYNLLAAIVVTALLPWLAAPRARTIASTSV